MFVYWFLHEKEHKKLENEKREKSGDCNSDSCYPATGCWDMANQEFKKDFCK